MTRRFLGYGRQSIDADDIAAVTEVLGSDYLTQGPAVDRFEAALADAVGARHAVAVCNGTAALHLACLAAGIGPGDKAIAPTLTFVATANAPLYCQGETVLADIDGSSLGLSVATAAAAVGSGSAPKALLPVFFAGLAEGAANLRTAWPDATIIADACHALGATHEDGVPVGSCRHYDMAAFSFHPVKPITTGEGGAITTNDDGLARSLRCLRNHGIERDPDNFVGEYVEPDAPWLYEQQMLGYNYRMTDLQAALGLSQLKRLPSMISRRRKIASYYDDRLSAIEQISISQSSPAQRARSGLHLYQIAADFSAMGRTRTKVMSLLRDAGIGTQVHYIPVHRQPVHRDRGNWTCDAFPQAERHYRETLSIPLFPSMTDGNVEYVADQIEKIFK